MLIPEEQFSEETFVAECSPFALNILQSPLENRDEFLNAIACNQTAQADSCPFLCIFISVAEFEKSFTDSAGSIMLRLFARNGRADQSEGEALMVGCQIAERNKIFPCGAALVRIIRSAHDSPESGVFVIAAAFDDILDKCG